MGTLRNKISASIVIFGATGNLYADKLARALFLLFREKAALPEAFKVIAFARKDIRTGDFRDMTRGHILKRGKVDSAELDEFVSHIEYFQGDFLDKADFFRLKDLLARDANGLSIFHLATAATLYEKIFENIKEAELQKCKGEARVMIEKPFGKNGHDAKRLSSVLSAIFSEEQIFHVDHYLAKETARAITPLPPGLAAKIKIIFHESNVVGSRGASYDATGAFRDVGENHMLELLALLIMEKPDGGKAESARKARAKALRNLYIDYTCPITKGQYESYRSGPGIDPDSKTETFFRVFLRSHDPRFKDTLFELESGKGLIDAGSDITTTTVAAQVYFIDGKMKELKIQPVPGTVYESYTKVYTDALAGDQALFVGLEEIMSQWKLADELLEKWQDMPLVIYKDGARPENIQ